MFVDRQNEKPAKFVDFVRAKNGEVWIKLGETTSFGIRNLDAISEIRMKWRWAFTVLLLFLMLVITCCFILSASFCVVRPTYRASHGHENS